MQINDEGIIIKKKKYRESSLLITFFSLNHGINSGLVKGVLKKDFGTYEIGNKVYIKSTFRLDDQLWNCRFELIKNNSVNYFDDQNRLNTLLTVCSIIDLSLPRNNPYVVIYNKTVDLIEDLLSDEWVIKYIYWELFLLSELGYGLDLEKCVVSGKKKNLIYISPKSGKAVSEEEGKKYKDKLFKLPKFLIKRNVKPNEDSLKQALLLSGFFIDKFLKKNNKKMPFYRKKILT
jgi:DNA repair protein RecO (recombination protein O)